MADAIITGIVGIILLAAGIGMRTVVSRREFYRRNESGLQTFSSYGSSVATTAGERLLRMIGCVLGVVGVLVAAAAAINIITH